MNFIPSFSFPSVALFPVFKISFRIKKAARRLCYLLLPSKFTCYSSKLYLFPSSRLRRRTPTKASSPQQSPGRPEKILPVKAGSSPLQSRKAILGKAWIVLPSSCQTLPLALLQLCQPGNPTCVTSCYNGGE